MSCYHPMIAFKNDYTNPANPKYKFFGKLEDVGQWEDIKKDYDFWNPILLPCGKCKGCRLDLSRKWADRMCLEYDHTKKAVFVTLTYDNEHLPLTYSGYPTLCKEDLQTFMKDLRGNKYYENKEIRFYGVGEYGSKFGRPHLHVILFGLGLEDFSDSGTVGEFHNPDWYCGRYDHELYFDGKNELKDVYYRSPHLDNVIWKKGRCCIAEFSWKSAAYTARYVRKKLNGELESEYGDRLPPFALMSRRPGIAGYFIEDHPEKDFFEENYFSFDGKQRPIPDYLFDKLEGIDRDSFFVYHAIKDQRKVYAEDNMLLKLQQTDLSFEELLTVEENRLETVSTSLRRNLE